MSERHDIWTLLDTLQMDHRAMGAKIVALRARVSQLDLPDRVAVTCPHCELECRGANTLAEHLHVMHDGPLPAHTAAADELVA